MKPIELATMMISDHAAFHPKGDARLAADLGVKIKPEEQDEVPPVVLGNAGYETDASGRPVELPNIESKFFAELFSKMPHNEKCSFRQGLIYARYLVVGKVENWSDVHEFLKAAEQRIKD